MSEPHSPMLYKLSQDGNKSPNGISAQGGIPGESDPLLFTNVFS